MASRFWVGGSGTWNTTNTTNWSASTGGSGGASVPTAADSVFFDQAGTYTVTMTGALTCLDITVSAGTVTFATGTTPTLAISGSMSLVAGTVWNSTGAITFNATTTGKTVTTNGVAISTNITFNGTGGGWTLGSALTSSNSFISILAGTFDTSAISNYSVTCTQFTTNSSSTRTINLNASTITCSISASTAFNVPNNTGLTFNAGTSQINLTNATSGIASAGVTFYNVAFTSPVATGITITGANTFNTLSFAGRTSVGITPVTFAANQTISTLTLNAGTNAVYRTFLASNTIGTQRTLAVTTLTAGAADYDFRDIEVTGTTLTGTRFGDCKGNSGITFPSAKTVYWNSTSGGNWGTTSWFNTPNGTGGSNIYFPLAQDTVIFSSSYPSSGGTITVNANYNIGTIDMQNRTSNTMTLATGATAPQIYGNWINGTGTTVTGNGIMTFAGRGSQTITSAGKTFTQAFTINSPSGSVTLQDAFVASASSNGVLTLTFGTFDANGYSVTLSGALSSFSSSNSNTRTVAIGSGTWTIAGSNGWVCGTSTNLTITGTGTISLTSASAKTFAGGGIQTYPTLNQGGAGALTITGSNGFANITNTYSATGATSVLFTAGTTNIFTAFNLTGAAGAVCTLGSTTTSQATLQKSSTWYMGANSTNGGNNTGLTFSAGGGIDYLSVSYINGTVVSAVNYGGFFPFFS